MPSPAETARERTVRGGLAVVLLVAGCRAAPQERPDPRASRLDGTAAFFYPAAAAAPDDNPRKAVARVGAVVVDAATWHRFQATGRRGRRGIRELAFDLALVQECRTRRLARSAPLLARSAGTARFHESGRRPDQDPDGALQRKFTNEALRQLRVDALVREERRRDEVSVRGLFERRYGVDGVRVKVRHVLVAFDATRRRLGGAPDEAAVVAAAQRRARELHDRLREGASFASLLPESDDRLTRRLLRDGAVVAGVVQGYNYRRFGPAFAAAVRGLDVGACSAPVRSEAGFHLIELLGREVTRFADVEAEIRRIVERGPATPGEEGRLRQRLTREYPLEVLGPLD